MPYLVARILNGASQITIPTKFSNEGISNFRIHSFHFTGLPNSDPIALLIRNQPTSPISGNVDSGNFPLMVATFPTSTVQLQNPIRLTEGDNKWNSATALDIQLLNYFSNNPATFSTAIIVFQYETPDRFNVRDQPPPDFKATREDKETVIRNLKPLPNSYFNAV